MSNEYKDYYMEVDKMNDRIIEQLKHGEAVVTLEELEQFLPEVERHQIASLVVNQLDKDYFMIDVDPQTRMKWQAE